MDKMQIGLSYHNNQLRDYSSLFSRSEVLSWYKKDFTSINYKIERYDEQWYKLNKATYMDYLKYVYSILESHYQNEYVFKNTFLNDWLIKEIGEQNSKVFNEFRVGNAIADLVMFNGHSKIFEIKTGYDTDTRLPLQLENYRKAFNQIFLIVPESKLSIYEKYAKNIGLISFNSDGRNRFQLHRDAEINLEIDSATLMNILHTEEYKKIVKYFYGSLPKMTSFNQFIICKELIEKIPSTELNKLFIAQIKKRGTTNTLSTRYYKEFNQLCLALKMNKAERNQMIANLKTQLHT
jgi:hypothetical protein